MALFDDVKNVIKKLNQTDLVLHIGDISYAVGYSAQWDRFLDQIKPVASRVPYDLHWKSWKAKFSINVWDNISLETFLIQIVITMELIQEVNVEYPMSIISKCQLQVLISGTLLYFTTFLLYLVGIHLITEMSILSWCPLSINSLRDQLRISGLKWTWLLSTDQRLLG